MSREFIIRQRAFLKMYLLTLIEKQKEHGWSYLEELREQLSPFGYKPTHSELYRALHELTDEGYIYPLRKKIEGAKRQEVVQYRYTEEGMRLARRYKAQVKADLERCIQLFQKALRDNF